MWHIGSQVQELKKIVLQNKEVLVMLRTNFDKPETMKELAKRLTNVDSVLQVCTVFFLFLPSAQPKVYDSPFFLFSFFLTSQKNISDLCDKFDM